MRNPWRLLILRSFARSSIHTSRIDSLHLQVRKLEPQKSCYLSSFLGRNAQQNSLFAFGSDARNLKNRSFSSESALEHKDIDNDVLIDIFSKSISSEDIKNELESINLSISHEMVLAVLQNLEENTGVALRFFNWVSETANERLSSKSYNLMLGILGRKDYGEKFWDLVEIMKKKGYGVSKGTYIKVSDIFEKEGMENDLAKLKEMFKSKSGENSTKLEYSRVCQALRENEWGDDVEKRLTDLNISWSCELVSKVLEQFGVQPMKALMFFWWVEDRPSFKHNKESYNAMVKVLGREDCIDKLWRVVNEMKEAGYEMEMETYVKVMGRFYKRRMIKDAVDLYEFMMGGGTKPPVQDSVFLLRKIVVGKDLDMDLFSRVVRIFTEDGNGWMKYTLDGVLKSLISVSKLHECNKILTVMEKGGFVVSNAVYNKIIFQLGKVGRLDEAFEILDEIYKSGCNPSFEIWASLIHGQCEAGDVDKASTSFRKMVEKIGVTHASYSFGVLVNLFCQKRRAEDAFKFLLEMVSEKKLKPSHTTYQMLIEKLLIRGSLKEALGLLGLMKNDGFAPFIGPFIDHISKSGTGDDAVGFLKAMTVKRFPSTSVSIRMFEAFLKGGRHKEAHDCLSKCPSYIRSHADVLNLFCSMKEPTVVTTVTAMTA